MPPSRAVTFAAEPVMAACPLLLSHASYTAFGAAGIVVLTVNLIAIAHLLTHGREQKRVKLVARSLQPAISVPYSLP
ncbi:hypothetical protein SBA5_410007 [Candidatus Sulfotelmatomonas gaucii]|uniref:Uncharacterized protein n=1 Tax=Candidatus Sulfuritelmatomonas gaucii TaxID=2043161 RepID=A0A2N9LLL9_9BACT|nr:hypothetical protein SBA5_410007 [Candidatus Sulfotelmatomonas gaucii]